MLVAPFASAFVEPRGALAVGAEVGLAGRGPRGDQQLALPRLDPAPDKKTLSLSVSKTHQPSTTGGAVGTHRMSSRLTQGAAASDSGQGGA